MLQGCRIPEASPLKTPGATANSLPTAALRPSAQAALQGMSAEQASHGFESALSQRPNVKTMRRSHRRKAPPERLPMALMQHRHWLMRGCEGESRVAHGGLAMATGDDEQEMCEAERALRHCLNLRTRRWANYEFVTASIDEPWLQQGSMAQLLDEIGLSKVCPLHSVHTVAISLFSHGLKNLHNCCCARL